MWNYLKKVDKEKYKTYITNFASLSEAFSQKSESDGDNKPIVTPIINSKFQETVFQKAFSAVGEDIANTSFDASVIVDDTHKYLVGIKSFGFQSGDQKIAQFKGQSAGWAENFGEIKFNASISKDKTSADKLNAPIYYRIAEDIAKLRNQRIESSKAQIRGFKSDDINVESVYHVLMPTAKDHHPQIHVGETSYLPIDIDQLEILGATSLDKPMNFKFTDGRHVYKYTFADSQLLMAFNNKEIIVESWDVDYIEDPFYLFENLHTLVTKEADDNIEMTVSWMIPNKNLEVEASSGFNGFNGGSKLSRKNGYREKRIADLLDQFFSYLTKDQLNYLNESLYQLLIPKYRTNEETRKMREDRQEFMSNIESFASPELLVAIEKLIYRDANEVYIPIPDSINFHKAYPNFFGDSIGTFKEGSRGKLALDKRDRTFTLRFLPSGDEIEAYINQENGKAIQSTKNQAILGEWIVNQVFQLKRREALTYQKLIDLHINAIRLIKYRNSKVIGIEFTWIDIENPPKDAIGWVSNKK
ncbi:hypothetical protein ACRPLU_04200 [Streptococcus uberis]|uniref:hypothetical protein n=1 Tax=Streptococcus uberis TaxID=1349 RepID=UPI0006203CF0|nr:hypothetical protein [Streptococcus uberis]KKF48791.1 hypothetical protein AF60_00305 [Streptococcus uberis S6261]MCK1238336.1 hypothetical protein [Streptococcus uberis]